jgi:hypothetical protein
VKRFKLFEHRYPPTVARPASLFEIVIEKKLTRNVELRAPCNARLLGCYASLKPLR